MEFLRRTRQYLSPNGNRCGWYALYRCGCGLEFEALQNNVNKGNTTACKNCGTEKTRLGVTKHGLTGTRTYQAWWALRQRCSNPKFPQYKDYGGRGITFEVKWKSFDAFLEDMGEAPSPKHQIDRIDVNGPYSAENCRWVTPSENARNTRRTVLVVWEGETLPLITLCERLGISVKMVQKRLARGWSLAEAITQQRSNRGGRQVRKG